jgi:hypothetical protein
MFCLTRSRHFSSISCCFPQLTALQKRIPSCRARDRKVASRNLRQRRKIRNTSPPGPQRLREFFLEPLLSGTIFAGISNKEYEEQPLTTTTIIIITNIITIIIIIITTTTTTTTTTTITTIIIFPVAAGMVLRLDRGAASRSGRRFDFWTFLLPALVVLLVRHQIHRARHAQDQLLDQSINPLFHNCVPCLQPRLQTNRRPPRNCALTAAPLPSPFSNVVGTYSSCLLSAIYSHVPILGN